MKFSIIFFLNKTALYMATELGNTETVHLLLERQDIDVNI